MGAYFPPLHVVHPTALHITLSRLAQFEVGHRPCWSSRGSACLFSTARSHTRGEGSWSRAVGAIFGIIRDGNVAAGCALRVGFLPVIETVGAPAYGVAFEVQSPSQLHAPFMIRDVARSTLQQGGGAIAVFPRAVVVVITERAVATAGRAQQSSLRGTLAQTYLEKRLQLPFG